MHDHLDFIAIFDGIENNPFMIKKLGWDSYGKNVSVSGMQNGMLLQFLTDYSGAGKGFNASIHFNLNDKTCKEWLNISFSDRTGRLESPNYPDLFNNSGICTWLIFIPQSNIQAITMEFEALTVSLHIIRG